MTWLLVYKLDPRGLPKMDAQTVTNWSLELKRTIMTEYAQRSMQAVLPKFDAETVCRGKVFQDIEAGFAIEMNGLLNVFGMSLLEGRVLKVIPPPILQYRLEQAAQQGVLTLAAKYPVFQPTEVLRAEAVAEISKVPK